MTTTFLVVLISIISLKVNYVYGQSLPCGTLNLCATGDTECDSCTGLFPLVIGRCFQSPTSGCYFKVTCDCYNSEGENLKLKIYGDDDETCSGAIYDTEFCPVGCSFYDYSCGEGKDASGYIEIPQSQFDACCDCYN